MNEFDLANFDYQLAEGLIAQAPASPRDASRLLVVKRGMAPQRQMLFRDVVGFFKSGDVLVLNDTRVINARLYAKKATGAKIEVLLVREREAGLWVALVDPGRRLRVGDDLLFAAGFRAKILEKLPTGARVLKFSPPDIAGLIAGHGQTPLPHYIKSHFAQPQDYQTVYAVKDGAVAAPTAGLHFTPQLLESLQDKGVEIVQLTLHCGPATFRPLKCQDIRDHKMDVEWVSISSGAAKSINQAIKENRLITAVGTTAARSLESAALKQEEGYLVSEFNGFSALYITPGYQFKIVNRLITNFHTPRSTNLVLVSVFAGQKTIRQAYRFAIEKKFRFFSFGDAMIIL